MNKFYQMFQNDKDVIHIYNGILLSHKNNKITSFEGNR